MRALRIIATTLFLVPAAFAVQPQFWRIANAEDFLAGESNGIAVTSRGELRSAPTATKIAALTEPFVLSQTHDGRGNLFVGTGNEGKVYQLSEGTVREIFDAPEPEIYAMAWHRGQLLVASSPNGKVYRVDPASKKSSVFFAPEAGYIWSLASAGDALLVATGTEGKLFRVTPEGKSTVLYDAPELHIRSVAVLPDGRVWAGGSGEGRIYEISSSGVGRALYDSALTEISALHFDRTSGFGWAAAASSALPTAAPPKQDPSKQQTQTTATATATAEGQKPAESATASVDVSFSFDGQQSTPAGVSELYRIHPDGYVEVMRKFDREIVYALSDGGDGALLAATGPNGRLYRLSGGDIELIANVPEKQIVSAERSGENFIVTTTNAGAVYRINRRSSSPGEFKSAVKDLERFSRIGEYRLEGKNLVNAKFAIRTGNTNTPDDTWSSWVEARGESGALNAPSARYAQVRLELPSGASSVIDSVAVAYVNRNVAPIVDSIIVHEPGVVFVSSAYPAAPSVVEATNPDEHGIFTSLDNPRDRNDPGKRVFRKGYRTISWKVRDENGDSTRSSVFFRQQGSDKWLRMRENLDESSMNFDATQLPDGRYEVRVVASDATDNPGAPLEGSRDDAEFVVDNTPPTIRATARGFVISDTESPLVKVEYSIDAEKWIRIVPDDALLDSRDETFTLPDAARTGKFVTVRAVDAHYNVTTQALSR